MGTTERAVATAVDENRRRELNRPAFVLHGYPWKETSLLVELFTRTHGRLAVVAKGARRPHSQLRGLLMAFQPLLVTWSGRGEVKLLHGAEWQGGVPQLAGVALLCGFYLNELLVKALIREDAHEELFDAYDEAIRALGSGDGGPGDVLRRFEKRLLAELGYGLVLQVDTRTGEPIDPRRRYRYVPERGPVAAGESTDDDPLVVRGRTLHDLDRDSFEDPVSAAESKRLLRQLIFHHLGQPELHTRQLIKDLQQL